MGRKIISLILVLSLLSIQAGLAEVGQLNLANYLSQGPKTFTPLGFQPPVLRYFSYDASADNFQLLLDPQDLKDKLSEDQTKSLAQEQLNYFLVGLSLPNSKFWVNLRPDAPDNIIEPELEQTEVGRIMLESDLQLKKDTAAFTSPQTKEGRVYWDKLYQKAKELFGTEPANIPTITRPWIVPGEILIREDQGAAYVYKATLKVMLEEDYLERTENRLQRTDYSFKDPRMKELNVYSSQLIRELILPKLTQEVNSGKNYASLRQVYFSLVLSRWFKMRFASQRTENREPKTEQANLIRLIDTGDLTNLRSQEPWSKTTYFKEYQKSFAQGEYNLKEQVTTPTGQVIRSYVSGGLWMNNMDPKRNGGGSFNNRGGNNRPKPDLNGSVFFNNRELLLWKNNVNPADVAVANSPLDTEAARDNFLNILKGYKHDVRKLSWRYVFSKWGWKMSILTKAITDEIKIFKKKRKVRDFFAIYISMPEYIEQSWDNLKKVSDYLFREINYKEWLLFQESLSLPRGRWLHGYTNRSGLIEDVYETTYTEEANRKKQEKLEKTTHAILSVVERYEGLLEKLRRDLKSQSPSSLEAATGSPKLPQVSSAVVQQKIAEEVVKHGGIDFTDIEKYLQYDGNFKGLDLSLPLLSKKELEILDLEKEEQTLRNYLATGFNPNGDRLKRLLAGLFQKEEFSSKQLDLLRLSQNLCSFLSARGMETTPDQRAFILITDTGLYTMRQESLTKYSPN